MSYPVTYYCPHCGAYVELEREGYLADRSVTPYPLAGWEYAAPDEDFERADGVRFVCGEDVGAATTLRRAPHDPDAVGDVSGIGDDAADAASIADGFSDAAGNDAAGVDDFSDAAGDEEATRSADANLGCGETVYLSFVRYEDGTEVEARPESEYVTIGR
ncbi:MAG: hypothetical protein ABEJ22_01620 [Haloferacaceae archaeon]